VTWDLRGAECNSAVPGPGRTEHEERLSEGSEGGQSQDTITREKRLTGPEGHSGQKRGFRVVPINFPLEWIENGRK